MATGQVTVCERVPVVPQQLSYDTTAVAVTAVHTAGQQQQHITMVAAIPLSLQQPVSLRIPVFHNLFSFVCMHEVLLN